MKSPIHDITDPAEFLPASPDLWQTWWFWLAIGTALILINLSFFFILRKKSTSQQRHALLEKARAQLDKLKSESDTLKPQTISVRISLIIRQYLEAAFDDPALFETNEEFSLRPHALAKLHPDCRQSISKHLTELSQLKYSPTENQNHILALIDQAGDVLVQIKPNVSPLDALPTE